MEWKKLGNLSKIGSPKEQVLKMFRSIRSLGKRDANVSSLAPVHEDLGRLNSFNSQAYIIAERRMHEIEAEKAMILNQLRHEKWKAGGPV